MRHRLYILLLLLPLVTGGCTGLLWDSTDWENRPAGDPRLRLFQAERQQDFLVVYREYCERTKATRQRAYLLDKNQSRVEQIRRPHFASTRMAQGLPEVPVFPEPMPADTNSLPALYGIVSTNTESFMIYSNHQVIGSHDLPIYPDPASETARFALSPIAVTVDVVLVAGAIYFAVIAPDYETWPNQ